MMYRRVSPAVGPIFLGGLLAFAFLVAGAASAASSRQVVEQFRRAQMYERFGRNAQAIALYRRIWEEMPTRSDAAIRGAQLLLTLDRSAEAVTWLRAAVAASPGEPLLWVEYGDALDRTGKPTGADSVWNLGARSVENPLLVYLGVADRLINRGGLRRALTWTMRGAALSDNRTGFDRRLFSIHLGLGHAADAARYAAAYVGASRKRVREILDDVGRAELSKAAKDSMAEVAMELSDAEPRMAGRALLAAEFALDVGRKDQAAERYLRSVSAAGGSANAILALAGRLDRRGYRGIAAHLYEQLVDAYPLTPLADRSAYRAAVRYEESGKRERARALYHWLIERRPNGYEDRARLALGRLLLEDGDIAGARRHYAAVSRAGKSSGARREAMFGLAECAFRAGRLDEAETRWRTLARNAKASPDAVKARERLAELAMYRGDAREMGKRCDEIVGRWRASDEANDCLALTGFLAEAGYDTAAWARYGRLRYELDRGNPDSVLAGVNRIAGSPLWGRGLLLAAKAELAKSRPEAAAESLLVAANRFAGTQIGEEAEWRRAELYRIHLNANRRTTLDLYERFLRTYPESVYAGKARRWVLRLRESGAT